MRMAFDFLSTVVTLRKAAGVEGAGPHEDRPLAIDVEHCYRRYGAMVYRRCHALLRDEQLAEDVMQDVFVKLFTHEETLEDQGLSSLLYRIATRESLNRLRSRRRRPEAPLDPIVEQLAGLEDDEGRSSAKQLLDRLFGVEQESSRVIALMHLHDGFTLEQVAEHTGMSVSGVRKRLRGMAARLSELSGGVP
jgi:RNA polymerase sigma-70 factor (ECF subfamily)